jgi:hypothetical protein
VTELVGRAGSALPKISGIDPEIDQKSEALDSLWRSWGRSADSFSRIWVALEFDPFA